MSRGFDWASFLREVLGAAEEALKDEELSKSLPPEVRAVLELAVMEARLILRIAEDGRVTEEEVRELVARSLDLAEKTLSKPEIQEAVPARYRVVLRLALAIVRALASFMLR